MHFLTSIPDAPSTLGHARGSVLVPWLMSPLPNPTAAQLPSGIAPAEAGSEHRACMHFPQHHCNQLTALPSAPI